MIIVIKGLGKVKRLLDPKNVEKATVKALNRTADKVRTAASKSIRETYKYPAARLKKGMPVKRANRRRLQAVITASGRRPGLQHFGAQQTIVTSGSAVRITMGKHGMTGRTMKRKKKAEAVTVEILKGRRITLKRGFMAVMPHGGSGVFQRTGKDRLPIRRLTAPSPANLFTKKGLAAAQRTARLEFDREFKHQYEFYRSRSR